MTTWNQSLNAAGVWEPRLRRDYGVQRRLVSRFRRTSYLAARVLLPGPVLPHVVAATAFMHHGDNLLDTGPKPQRAAAWAAWERRVRQALDSAESDDPLLRTLLHTITARPRLREVVETYLSTATAELEFAGFATEADYQAYVDAYSLPAFMLVASLVSPEGDDGPFRAACRAFIDGSQRLDFVNDLAEDLREDRLGIPAETLKRFSVTPEELATTKATPGVRELVEHEVAAARADLKRAEELPAVAPAPYRPLLAALVEIELMTADAALTRGAGLLRDSADPPLTGALRVLLTARRQVRDRCGTPHHLRTPSPPS